MKNKKIGLIVPSSNMVMEVDFYSNIPKPHTVHISRMLLKDTTVEGEEIMLEDYFPQALENISTVKPDITIFGCTSAGALKGNKYEEKLLKKISETTEGRAISVIKTVREKLKKLKIKNLLVLTPYVDSLNYRIKSSIEEEEINVKNISGLGISENYKIGEVQPKFISEFILEKYKKFINNIDGIFISCTNFRAIEALEFIQPHIEIPILTSNKVVLDKVLEYLE